MKIALSALLLIHSIIHLLGALKAFRPQSVPQLKQPVTRRAGKFWFLASALFLLSFAFSIGDHALWWVLAAAAVLLSQILIIGSWRQARFGTLINVIVLCAGIIGFGQWKFYGAYAADVRAQLPPLQEQGGLLTEQDIHLLPEPVQKYLRITGALNKPRVQSFRTVFTGRIRSYEKKEWMNFSSVQYNFQQPASRLFFMKATMNYLPVAGYHRYVNGAAFMDIRLLSLFTVQYESGNEMNIAETVTFFNDMCVMAPGTLVDRRIQWTAIDNYRADATFTNNGITIRASLFFNASGELINFISPDRYSRQADGSMQQMTWSTPLKNYREINGMYLPGDAETVYAYPDGEFSYGEFHTESVTYNPATFEAD